jgi:hypothetical protein
MENSILIDPREVVGVYTKRRLRWLMRNGRRVIKKIDNLGNPGLELVCTP